MGGLLCGQQTIQAQDAPVPPLVGAPTPPFALPPGGVPSVDAPYVVEDHSAGAVQAHGDGGDSKDNPFAKMPPIYRYTFPGVFFATPTGEGYYSLYDLVTGNLRQAPPKWPYPRLTFDPFPFFDADFRYLDDPNNQDTDWADCLKRIRLGDNWMFTTGGEARYQQKSEVNSRLFNTGRLAGSDNSYALERERVWGDLFYQDIFRIYAEFISANSSHQTLPPLAIDIDRKDFLNLFTDVKLLDLDGSPIYFRAGRQELVYGSQRLISPLDWANTRRTFDGFKAFYRGEDLDIDAWLTQPVLINADGWSRADHQQTFSGTFLTYRPEKLQEYDLYVLDLDNTKGLSTGHTFEGRPVTGDFNCITIGGRTAGNYEGWLWDVEPILQCGTWVNQNDFAYAWTYAGGYAFQNVPMVPQFWLAYDFASGNQKPGVGNVHGTFQPLFPFGHYYMGFLDLVGRQNINDYNAQVVFFPTDWITVVCQEHIFRLDSAKDALYSKSGAVERVDPTGRAGKDVGDEFDFYVNFHLSNHQDVLFGYSYLAPGDFIRNTATNARAARSPELTYLQYSFKW